MTAGQDAAALVVRGVVVRRGAVTILDGVGFQAHAGRVTGLLGANGAGKSTLLRAIAGIEPVDAGSVHAGDEDVLALRRRVRARLLALVEQDASTELPFRGRAVVALGRTPHEAPLGGRDPGADAAVDRALAATGATPFADRELGTLSGGERQRVLLARALAQEPRILLLDEPTTHLDVGAQLEILRMLQRVARADGVTVVAALHDLTVAASHVDDVVVLHGGRVLASGPPRDVLTNDLVRRVYGVDAAWTTHPITGAPLLAIAPASTAG